MMWKIGIPRFHARRNEPVDLAGDWWGLAREADDVWLRINHPEKLPPSVLRNLRPVVTDDELCSPAYRDAHLVTTNTRTVAELSLLLAQARTGKSLALAYWCARTALERSASKRTQLDS